MAERKPESLIQNFERKKLAEAKKLFVDQKNGTLKCTKGELDVHVKNTYTDGRRFEALPPMEKLAVLPEPKFKFAFGDLMLKEVDDIVKMTRAKSDPGVNGVLYKVYTYCK